MAVKLFVTGSEGQLARALTECAADRDDLDLVCAGRPQFDLEQPETIERAVHEISPDVIVSAAAYTTVDQAEDEPQLAMRINGDAAGLVARAARSAGAKLIHVSTDYVYDGTKSAPYEETDPVAPQSVYGMSKLAGEFQVRAEHPEAVLVRTAWVYSPFGRNFVKTMLDVARTRNQLTVVDDQYGSPTSAHDIADAILAMLELWRSQPGKGAGEIYHCAGAGQATWYELARRVFATSKANGGPFAEVAAMSTRDWPTKAVRPRNSRLDCSKIRLDFSWQAPDWRTSVDVVVQKLLMEQAVGKFED